MRVVGYAGAKDPRRVFETSFGAASGLLDAADLLALSGAQDAAQELMALARKHQDAENALARDTGGPPGSLACITVNPADAAAMLRLLKLLESAETKLITGEFLLRPEHIPRWSRELVGMGRDEGGEPRKVSLWDEYQRIYKTLALLEGAALEGQDVEICQVR
jgi:hypothetical protein